MLEVRQLESLLKRPKDERFFQGVAFEDMPGLLRHLSDMEVDALQRTLAANQISIQVQLRDPNKLDEQGRRLSGIEYQRWRFAAVGAVSVMQKQLIALKAEKHRRAQDGRISWHHVARALADMLDDVTSDQEWQAIVTDMERRYGINLEREAMLGRQEVGYVAPASRARTSTSC